MINKLIENIEKNKRSYRSRTGSDAQLYPAAYSEESFF